MSKRTLKKYEKAKEDFEKAQPLLEIIREWEEAVAGLTPNGLTPIAFTVNEETGKRTWEFDEPDVPHLAAKTA